MTNTEAQNTFVAWWKATYPGEPVVQKSTVLTTWMLQAAAPILAAGYRPIAGEPSKEDWIVAQELINWEEMPYARKSRTPDRADLIFEEDGHDAKELIFLAKLVANAGAVDMAKRRAALASANFRVGRWQAGMSFMGGGQPVETLPDVLTVNGVKYGRVG